MKRGPSCGTESPNRKQKRSASPEDHFSFLKKDLILFTVTTQKSMWKREKIGSTARLGTHHVLPAFSLSPNLLKNLHTQLCSQEVDSTTLFIPPKLSSLVQLYDIKQSQTLLPSIKVFLSPANGSNTERDLFKEHIESIDKMLLTTGSEQEIIGAHIHQFHPLAFV